MHTALQNLPILFAKLQEIDALLPSTDSANRFVCHSTDSSGPVLLGQSRQIGLKSLTWGIFLTNDTGKDGLPEGIRIVLDEEVAPVGYCTIDGHLSPTGWTWSICGWWNGIDRSLPEAWGKPNSNQEFSDVTVSEEEARTAIQALARYLIQPQ